MVRFVAAVNYFYDLGIHMPAFLSSSYISALFRQKSYIQTEDKYTRGISEICFISISLLEN